MTGHLYSSYSRTTARFPVPAKAEIREGNTPLAATAGIPAVRTDRGATVCDLASVRYHFGATSPAAP
jgi:hypothetical protein